MSIKKPKAKYESVMLIDDSEIDNFINQGKTEEDQRRGRLDERNSAGANYLTPFQNKEHLKINMVKENRLMKIREVETILNIRKLEKLK